MASQQHFLAWNRNPSLLLLGMSLLSGNSRAGVRARLLALALRLGRAQLVLLLALQRLLSPRRPWMARSSSSSNSLPCREFARARCMSNRTASALTAKR